MADAGQYELLDPVLDAHHRSRHSTMLPPEGEAPTELGALRLRTPIRAWRLHPDWLPRLRATGLLPLARMVEATWQDDQDCGPGRTFRRFPYDRALLTTLVDRWRPETHTFHLPCGEMAPTLPDVSFLTGLPCAGIPLAAYDILATWRTDLLARFHDVLPSGSEYTEFSSPHGPTLRWICQFYNVGAVVVRRHFKAYLLWLFGWVMFLGSHGDSVDKHYVRYARELADLPEHEIPSYAWGPAVLCATYRALCDACHRAQDSSILSGCPLLLQLWSLERFQIGRPQLDLRAYEVSLYAQGDDVDQPTMGTAWCRRRGSYPEYVAMFDQLTDDRVIWTPYTDERVNARAPGGLSSLCTRDYVYWYTRRVLVHDVFVEEYQVQLVMH